MTQKKEHIDEIIDLLPYELTPTPIKSSETSDDVTALEKFKETYGTFPFQFPDTEDYIAMIDDNLFGILDGDVNSPKTIIFSKPEHFELLKILPLLRNSEKIEKIVIECQEDNNDDPFKLLLKCPNLFLKEITINSEISIEGFKSYAESKGTKNLEVLSLGAWGFSDMLSFISPKNCPKLKKLVIFCHSYYKIKLNEIFECFNYKLNIEFNLQIDSWDATCDMGFANIKKMKDLPLEILIKADSVSQYDEPDFQKHVKQMNIPSGVFVKSLFINRFNQGNRFLKHMDGKEFRLKTLHMENIHMSEDHQNFLNSNPDSETYKFLQVLEINNCMSESQSPQWLKNLPSLELLEELTLKNCNYFTNQDWIDFMKSGSKLKNLKKLDLSFSKNIDSVVVKELCDNFKNLGILILSGTDLKDDSLQYIEKLTSLKELSINENNDFTESGLTTLFNSDAFKSLRKIDLSKCQNVPMERIIGLLEETHTDLKTIHGSGYPFILNLVKCKHLKNYSFYNNLKSIHENRKDENTSFGESHFQNNLFNNADLLHKLWFIKSIKKSEDRISENTLKVLVGYEKLNPFFKKQIFFSVFSDEITNGVLQSLANNKAFMKYLYKIDVSSFNSKIDKDGVASIFQSPYISKLFDWSGFLQGIKEHANLGSKKEQFLKFLKTDQLLYLKKLDLSGFDLTKLESDSEKFFTIFDKNLPNLKDLNLSSTNLNEKIMSKLFLSESAKNMLNSLMMLSLNENTALSEDGFNIFFDFFTENTKLLGLELEKCPITNENLKKITKKLKKLRYLSIKGCIKIDDEGLETLIAFRKNNGSFKMMKIYEDFKDSLCIDQTNNQINVLLRIEELYSIQRILVNNQPEEKEAELKEELKKIKSNVSTLVLKKFLEKEKRIETFKKLDFSNCPIDSSGLESIANCKFLSNLETLSLKNTNIDDSGIKFLTESKILSLKKLEIEGCKSIKAASLKYILSCKNFDEEFNPEKILENYADMINEEILDHLEKSNYIKNVKTIYFKPKKLNNDSKFKCLEKLIELDKKNLIIQIEEFSIMMNQIKDYIDHIFLEKLVNTKIFSELESLELNSKKAKHSGLKAVIESSNLNKKFQIQKLIINNMDLMSDCVLESLSKSRCFEGFQYDTKLAEKKKKEKAEEQKVEKKQEENSKKDQEEDIKNEITSEGLWFLSLSSNVDFDIQGLINDFADMITSSFVKNMVQQPYFRKICKNHTVKQTTVDKGKEASISFLNLSKCVGLKDDDLCVIIRSSNPEFDLEEFIKKDNLPNKDVNLVTNNVLKAITKSAYIQNHYCKESSPFTEFKRFSFDVSKYPKVDYAINDLIQAHASQIRYYAVYLQNYTAYLSSGSLRIMRNDIRNYKIYNTNMMNKHKMKDELIKKISIPYNDEEKIFDLLLKIKVLKFSQNKFIYDPSFEMSLKGAFVNFQNQNDLNLNSKTIDYYVKKIVTIQEKHSSPELFDKDHEVLLDLIKLCNNLEEINLNNINLGDDFLKHFSIYLSERPDHFRNLEVLEIKNNDRITSVGLKYLYCSIISRCNVLTTIKVDDEETNLSTKTIEFKSFTTFVNSGLKGMIDFKLKQAKSQLASNYRNCIFKEMHPKKKELLMTLEAQEDEEEVESLSSNRSLRKKSNNSKKIIDIVELSATLNGSENANMVNVKTSFKVRFLAGVKFIIRKDTLIIVGVIFLFTPLLMFHLFEKLLFAVPKYLNACFLSLKKTKVVGICVRPIIYCWRYVLEKFYDCFGNCFHFNTGDKSPKKRIPQKDRQIQLKDVKSHKKLEQEKKEINDQNNNTDHPITNIEKPDKIDQKEDIEQMINKRIKKMEEEYEKKIQSFIDKYEKKIPKGEKSLDEDKMLPSEKSPSKSPLIKNEEAENLIKKDEILTEGKKEMQDIQDKKASSNQQKKKEETLEDQKKETNQQGQPTKKDQADDTEKRPSKTHEEEATNPEAQSKKQEEKKEKKKSLTSMFCSCMSCYKIKEAGKKESRKELMERYQQCKMEILKESSKNEEENESSSSSSSSKGQNSGTDQEDKQSSQQKPRVASNVNYSSYFYYDESLIKLNAILSGQSLKKSKINSIQPLNDVNLNEEKENLDPTASMMPIDSKHQAEIGDKVKTQPFLIISKLKWVILLDYIACYVLVLFYLPFLKLNMHEDASLRNQIPYFVYGFCSFLLEVCICWEVTSVINNQELTSMWDSTILSNLITSQTAKYDTFTNLTFVFLNLKYDPANNSFEFNEIFIPAMIFVGLNIILNFKNFLVFLWKNFISKKKNRKASYHSSEFINRYSKLSFQFEFQSLGRLLDRFSTNSAKKYGYWFLPKTLKNSYIPTVITTTFARLFLEDVPLLIIQLYVLISKSVFDFTNIASLGSTILALFMTLHTTWNVKPSIFNKELFKGFFEQTRNVRKKMGQELRDKIEEKKKKRKEREEQEKNANKDNAAAEELKQRWNQVEIDDDQKLIGEYLDVVKKKLADAVEEKEKENIEKENKGKEGQEKEADKKEQK